jgi:putative transposase
MSFDPEIHARRSVRLKGYDYAQNGAYFFTIVVKGRECLFGNIMSGEMVLNDAGGMVQTVWDQLPEYYTGIHPDIFQIIPNHLHGIIILNNTKSRVGAGPCACPENEQKTQGQPQGIAPTVSLPDVVRRFKTLTTKRYIDGVKNHNWPPFPGRLWQRNYYEHVIRKGNGLRKLREYILNNPKKWEIDRENSKVPWVKRQHKSGGSRRT